MRAWSCPDGPILVEGAPDRTVIFADTPICDAGGTPLSTAFRYYRIDGDRVVEAYSGGTFSIEDELSGWTHAVVGATLVQYRSVYDRREARHTAEVRRDGLTARRVSPPDEARWRRAIEAHREGRRRHAQSESDGIGAILRSARAALGAATAGRLRLHRAPERPWAYIVSTADGRELWRTSAWHYHGVNLYDDLVAIARDVFGDAYEAFDVDPDLRDSMSWSDA